MLYSLSSCQGSQPSYLTSGIGPTGNVRRGLGLWEFCGCFDLDRAAVWENSSLGKQQQQRRARKSLSGAVLIIAFTNEEFKKIKKN